MATPHFEESPWFFKSDFVLTTHFKVSLNIYIRHSDEVLLGSPGVLNFENKTFELLHFGPPSSLVQFSAMRYTF